VTQSKATRKPKVDWQRFAAAERSYGEPWMADAIRRQEDRCMWSHKHLVDLMCASVKQNGFRIGRERTPWVEQHG
jgi:hypothetical protein